MIKFSFKNLFPWEILFTLVVSIDLISKYLFFRFYPDDVTYNPGVFLGSFASLDQKLRMSFLVTIGTLVFFIWQIFRHLVPTKSFFLRSGLTLLAGGVISNMIDRAFNGHVIDFIPLGNIVVNPADIFILLGNLFIIVGVSIDAKYYWPHRDLRGSRWIYPDFQFRFCLQLTLLTLSAGTIVSALSLSLIGFSLPVFLLFGLVNLFLALAAFCFGIYFSHRIAGPIYAIRKFFNELQEGKKSAFKLRENDEFRELEEVINKVAEKL
jgi:lipoprotein signal peptidase